MSIFSLSGISLFDAVDILNFGAIYIMSMVYITNVLSQKKLLKNPISIYASVAFLLVGLSITFACFSGIFSFDILHHWTVRLTMSVAMTFIIYSIITKYNEKRFEKVIQSVAVKNRDFNRETPTLNTKIKYDVNNDQPTNNLNLINKLQDEILSSVRGDLNNNISDYYEFSTKIYQLNGNISLLNEKIKTQNEIAQLKNQIFVDILTIVTDLARLCYLLSIKQSIDKCNILVFQILTIIGFDRIDIEIHNIYNLINEQIVKQQIREQIEQQSQKLYKNIADDIKEINGTNTDNIFDEDLLEEENKINSNSKINQQQKILRDKILTNAKQHQNQMFTVKNVISENNIVKSNEELSIDVSRLDRSFAIITQDMYGLKQDMFILRGNVQEAVDKIAKLFDLMTIAMESRQ